MQMKLIALALLGVLASPVQAMCDAQLKALQAEMHARQVSLDVRRKVNTAVQPLMIPRTDLNPLTASDCQKRVQAARELIPQSTMAMAGK